MVTPSVEDVGFYGKSHLFSLFFYFSSHGSSFYFLFICSFWVHFGFDLICLQFGFQFYKNGFALAMLELWFSLSGFC